MLNPSLQMFQEGPGGGVSAGGEGAGLHSHSASVQNGHFH